MPLSNKDLSDIAKEFGVAKSDQADDKAAIPNIEEQIKKKQDQADRMWIPYNNAQVERVTPYETEHRWLDGTTYTTITNQQIIDAGNRTASNIFFPTTWSKSNAQLTASGNGNPKTSSPNFELETLNKTLELQGLIAQIDLLRNGSSSVVGSDTLSNPYSPGAPTIQVSSSGHTNGKLLYISGSGTSACVRITNVSGTTLTITEIIPPANTISNLSSSVIENIPGFTNAERTTLTSVSYQRILTELTNRIITSAALWNSSLDNQLAQLNINIDAASQITAAKTKVNTAKTAYNTWVARSNTGASGKFVDTSLNALQTAYNQRLVDIPLRVSQITAALGSISQDSQGNYSGNGLYLQRFKTMNFLINTSNGPLFQLNGLRLAKADFEQKVANGTDKLATFSNIVRYMSFTADPNGSTVKVDDASKFAVSDSVLLTGNDLPSAQCTITAISTNNVTLSITIPKEYTKAVKSGIIKPI